MADPYISGDTLDDLLHAVVESILANGQQIYPSKGEATEITGVLLEVKDPRARLSRTETRGKPYSCLGELCWYLAKSNDVDFISYYLPVYRTYADGNIIFGGYGPRLFDWKNQNQFENITDILRRKPDSRQAVIQLFDSGDIEEKHNDVPCTCTLQFMIRQGKLDLIVSMRSNDAFWGLPHDIFSFTMLQEIMARSLSAELGTYKHAVGSLHLYEKTKKGALQFLNEGWQPTDKVMPPMPNGDPWPSIKSMLDAELAIRTRSPFDPDLRDSLDPYWADLIRLLEVFRSYKDKKPTRILELRESMSSDAYLAYIDGRLSRL